MIDGIKAALNSKPIKIMTPSILGGVAYGALLGPAGAFIGTILGLLYQTLRTVAIFLSYHKIKEETPNQNYLDETKKNAFNQGVRAHDSYLEWSKTFIPGKAAYKEPIYYYAGLRAKDEFDEELIDRVGKISTKPNRAPCPLK
ncbi:MAG: hypothetical protein JSR17_02110 [Proteobacteria bacterium]|nr:hypothetical protein [Pseudomonadota bacterium]